MAAAVLAPVASHVGLQIVLQPYQHTLGHIACTAVGVVYPAYQSFKAVELLRIRNETDPAAKWLTYWAVFGTLSAVERIIDKMLPWVPYYSVLKLAMLLWLQHPRYGGAYRLSSQFVRPLLHRAHVHIDAFLETVKIWCNRPEVVAVVDALNNALAVIPGLEWFVRGPDGRPISRRRPSFGRGRGGFITR